MDRVLVKAYKALYSKGTRIELIEMGNDEPRPIPKGTIGTVRHVDDMGTVHCVWDDGRCLGLVPEVDKFKIIKEGK